MPKAKSINLYAPAAPAAPPSPSRTRSPVTKGNMVTSKSVAKLVAPSPVAAQKDALLHRTTHARRRKSVERVWDALEDMRARRERTFAPASVERALKRLGYDGPTAQSMYNDREKELATLVGAYNEAHGDGPRSADDDDGDAALARAIPDAHVRRMVLMLRVENRSLKRSVARLQGDWAARLALSSVSHGGAEGTPNFTKEMVASVARFMRSLQRFGWEADEATGALLDAQSGKEVAGPGFLDALKIVIG